MAQSGSALAWGARGRKFKSCRPDENSLHMMNMRAIFFGGRGEKVVVGHSKSRDWDIIGILFLSTLRLK